jgi:polygalacturonase
MKKSVLLVGAVVLAGVAVAAPPEGMQWETAAIQAKIDAAAAKGGGRVTVGKGVHPCRTLYLKSGVELHLEEGAVILGGTKPEDYDDAMPLDQIYTYSNAVPATVTRKAFIFAEEAHGIAITGKGVIDNSGTAFFDHRTWAKPTHLLRPRTVIFLRCRDIRFEDTTFKDSPLWTMWLRFCENITVSRIRIEDEQRMINSDGIDFDGCRHVRVGDSYFKTGDDCVVLRAIRDERHKDVPVVTEDVVVSNCYFNTPCQGVRIGCPSDDTIRNAVFKNIEFHGSNAIGSQQPHRYLTMGDNGYLKTENILFEDWTIESGGHPLQLFVDKGIVLRDFGHMTFRNFNVKSKRPFMVRGNEASPVKDMHFENIKGTIAGKPFDVAHATIEFGQIDIAVWK